MLIDGSSVTENTSASYDVMVVGTGAGGAVVGKELAGDHVTASITWVHF